MDAKLLAWARAVKARHRHDPAAVPPLWIFTDRDRLPDPAPLVRLAPPGLCGMIYRPAPQLPAGELRRLRQLCRARRVALSVAGAWGGAGCGEHRAAGRRRLRRAQAAFATASAHCVQDLVRAERAGVALVFLSPVLATVSHPGAPSLGLARFALLARGRRVPVLALGGITGRSALGLPRFVAGAGAVGAMAPARAMQSG